MEHEGNDEEHQTAFIPTFLTVYLRDTVMADWIWEKRNVISISYQVAAMRKVKRACQRYNAYLLLTCGARSQRYWDMNQSLIYEVRQHSLLSVLAQLSSLQSATLLNKLPYVIGSLWVPYHQVLQKFHFTRLWLLDQSICLEPYGIEQEMMVIARLSLSKTRLCR